MARPSKRQAQVEKKSSGSSDTQQSSRESGGRNIDATQRSTPKSIPRLDGNRDPGVVSANPPVNYSKETDLKNISDVLGMAGWYTARGVSSLLSNLSQRLPCFLPVSHAASGCKHSNFLNSL